MKPFTAIASPDPASAAIQHKIDRKTKTARASAAWRGSRTRSLLQQTLEPELRQPHIVVFAGDHGAARAGSAYPQDVTWQMVENFLPAARRSTCFRQLGLISTWSMPASTTTSASARG